MSLGYIFPIYDPMALQKLAHVQTLHFKNPKLSFIRIKYDFEIYSPSKGSGLTKIPGFLMTSI